MWWINRKRLVKAENDAESFLEYKSRIDLEFERDIHEYRKGLEQILRGLWDETDS